MTGNWAWWESGGGSINDLGSTKISIGGQEIDLNSSNVYNINTIAYGDIIEVNGKNYQTLDLQIDGITLAREKPI